jgi:hypothetical protein
MSSSWRSMRAASAVAAAWTPTRAEAADRLRDVGQTAVQVSVVRHAGTFHLRAQIGLRAVEDDEVRPQRKDPLDVRIEQRADARQRVHLGRKAIVAADGDDAIARAHREQHLGRRGNDRDDAMSTARLPPSRRGRFRRRRSFGGPS